MLQSTMWSQLARLKLFLDIFGRRSIMESKCLSQQNFLLDETKEALKLTQNNKHWTCGPDKAVAVAATLLQQKEVIAIPTETVYGLACCAKYNDAIQKLYDIKKRDGNKPLSICLSKVRDIPKWSYTDHLPECLLEKILPGPYTVILPRKDTLNPALNPGCNTVGIRVPEPVFVRNIAALAEPLALTSANLSNEPSTTTPDEFVALWPQLAGIFHDKKLTQQMQISKTGSTIVDLTEPNKFKIVRKGVGEISLIKILELYGLKSVN